MLDIFRLLRVLLVAGSSYLLILLDAAVDGFLDDNVAGFLVAGLSGFLN